MIMTKVWVLMPMVGLGGCLAISSSNLNLNGVFASYVVFKVDVLVMDRGSLREKRKNNVFLLRTSNHGA